MTDGLWSMYNSTSEKFLEDSLFWVAYQTNLSEGQPDGQYARIAKLLDVSFQYRELVDRDQGWAWVDSAMHKEEVVQMVIPLAMYENKGEEQ